MDKAEPLSSLVVAIRELEESKSKLETNFSDNSNDQQTSDKSGEIVRSQRPNAAGVQIDDVRVQANHTPKVYPNNTLVEDLSKCHEDLRPGVVRAASKAVRLTNPCWSGPRRLIHLLSSGGRTREPEKEHDHGGRSPTRDSTAGQTEEETAQNGHRFQMPHSIVALNSTLSSDDYDRALRVLTGDIRYKLHLLLSRHLNMIWTSLSTALCILTPMLALSVMTVPAFVGTCSAWLLLQALGLVACKRVQRNLDRMLERSVAQANSFFMDHKLMLGVINAGGLMARSHFVVPLLFFDASSCTKQVETMIKLDLLSMHSGARDGDCETNQSVLARTQLAKKIVLSYSQRWISHFDRSKLLLKEDGSKPLHLSTGKCLCQFIEESLKGSTSCFPTAAEPDVELADTTTEVAPETSARGSELCDTTTVDIVGGPSTLSLDECRQGMDDERAQLGVGRRNLTDCVLNVADLVQINEIKGLKGANDGELSGKFVSSLQVQTNPEQESAAGLDLEAAERNPSRNKELFRSLELLLEFRSNELSRSLDTDPSIVARNQSGSHSNMAPNNSPDERRSSVSPTSSSDENSFGNFEVSDKTSHLVQSGKQFFSQVGRFSWFSTTEPHKRGFYANSSRQLLNNP